MTDNITPGQVALTLRCISRIEGHLLVTDPSTPLPVLLAMADRDDFNFGCQISEHPSIPEDVLVQWAEHPSAGIRQGVAWNPRVPAALPSRMLQASMSREVAALARLDQDADDVAAQQEVKDEAEIRRRLASCPVTPLEVLAQLTEDRSVMVRWAAAMNDRTPLDALEALRETERWRDDYLMRGASYLEIGKQVDMNLSGRGRGLSYTGNVPKLRRRKARIEPPREAEVLVEWSQHPNSSVRVKAAWHRRTPVSVLSEMLRASWDRQLNALLRLDENAEDAGALEVIAEEAEIRKALAYNSKSDPDDLAELTKDDDVLVRYATACNENTPQEALEALLAAEPWTGQILRTDDAENGEPSYVSMRKAVRLNKQLSQLMA